MRSQRDLMQTTWCISWGERRATRRDPNAKHNLLSATVVERK